MKCCFVICGILALILISGCTQEGAQTGTSGSASVEYGCEFSWYQEIIDKGTSEIVWVCTNMHPYCKMGTTECCKYNESTKEHYDCIDCKEGHCGASSPAYGNEPEEEPEESSTCSNSEYSTKVSNESWSYGFDMFITLDSDSDRKLKAQVVEDGSIALQGISSLSCLEYLDLSAFWSSEYLNITDISALSGLVNLKVLKLKATPISDISPVSNFTKLEQIELIDTDISDLSPLKNLNSLKSLQINLTTVSDLSPLSGLTKLEYFSMNRVNVTDISPLANLTNLKDADLMYNEQIPQGDCLALREQLPNTDVCCPGIGCDPRFN